MWNHVVLNNQGIPTQRIEYDEIVEINPDETTMMGLAGLGACSSCNSMMGLADVGADEAYQIALEHFQALPITTAATIALEIPQGKYDAVAREVAAAAEKICKAGIWDKATSVFDQYKWWFVGGAAGLITFYYLTNKKRK